MAHGNAAIWFVIAVIGELVLFDYLFGVRRTPALRETAVWSAIYLAIAVVFGGSAWVFAGTAMSVGYFARFVRNETLSVDAIVEVIAVVLLITMVAR